MAFCMVLFWGPCHSWKWRGWSPKASLEEAGGSWMWRGPLRGEPGIGTAWDSLGKRPVAREVIEAWSWWWEWGRYRRQKRGTEALETACGRTCGKGGPVRDVVAFVVEITPVMLGHLDSCNVTTRKTLRFPGLQAPVCLPDIWWPLHFALLFSHLTF